MELDYIIVGLGLAGLAFTKELDAHGKDYIVFNDDSQHSSEVAGGMYNPVILKRFTPVWDAIDQLEQAHPFYEELEALFKNQYNFPIDIYRIFKSIEEQNNWFVACDKPKLSPFMEPEIITKDYQGVQSDYGFGKLKGTGRIATKSLLRDYKNWLKERNLLLEEHFDYSKLIAQETLLKYKDIKAKHIVFCEGFGIKKNPYFKSLPLDGAKGEVITIHAPELNIDFLAKAAVFVLPLGDNLYKVGATFNWTDKTNTPTREGKEELTEKLDTFIDTPYTVVEHVAGVRPTVKDRRPLIGTHPTSTKLAVLNGLGTRGVMIAPKVAKILYDHLENGGEIPSEIDISRFYS